MTDEYVIQRGWFPYTKVAREYLGVSPDLLLGAIRRRELPAYIKPTTRGRTADAASQRNYYYVCLSDVDSWIRTFWGEPQEI